MRHVKRIMSHCYESDKIKMTVKTMIIVIKKANKGREKKDVGEGYPLFHSDSFLKANSHSEERKKSQFTCEKKANSRRKERLVRILSPPHYRC